jgi:hypothetical protein
MNPINAETVAAGELIRHCRTAAGPTQEELSENAELSVRARQRNALASCAVDTSRVKCRSSSGLSSWSAASSGGIFPRYWILFKHPCKQEVLA